MTEKVNIKEEIGLPKGFYWTPVPVALAKLKSCIVPKKTEKKVKTFDSMGCILSRNVFAQRSSPPLSNSAVDGFAFRYPKDGESRIINVISHTISPGKFPNEKISKGEGVKILTGGPIPPGTDTVILKEDISKQTSNFEVPTKIKKGENTRNEGEDKKAGELVLSKGHKLRSQDLALLISVGVLDVDVFERLNIGVLSTGDELVDDSKKAESFQIYDSNRPMIISKLQSWGYNTSDLGIVRDCEEGLKSKIKSSKGKLDLIVTTGGASAGDRDFVSKLQSWGHNTSDLGIVRDCEEGLKSKIKSSKGKLDLIVTTGGASAGDRDFVSKLLNSEGDLILWRVAIKPGRPFAMGFIEGIPIYSLPGNPVAAFVCALIFLKPSLDLLAGGTFSEPKSFLVKTNFSKSKKKGRREFLRARIDPMGSVEIFKSEGSGRISSLSWSDGLVELGEDVTKIKVGSMVKFLPYELF